MSSRCASARATSLEIEGVAWDVLYTPGHTDDSYSFLLPDRVFTGDTLLIRGTGRTDFQNGDPRAQYQSIFGKLLKLPDGTMVFPAHDYKGDTVSTIGEERAFDPWLQVQSVDEYVDLMNNLKLPNPKMMDVAVPANMHVGLAQDEVARRGWAVTAEEALPLLDRTDVVLVDVRERRERAKHGSIRGALARPLSRAARAHSQGRGAVRACSSNGQAGRLLLRIRRTIRHGCPGGSSRRNHVGMPHPRWAQCLEESKGTSNSLTSTDRSHLRPKQQKESLGGMLINYKGRRAPPNRRRWAGMQCR